MEIKKNPRKRLEAFSKIFFEIGLVLVLFIVYQLMEIKTYDNSLTNSLGEITMTGSDNEDTPIVKREEIIIPEKIVPPPPVPEKIKVVEDDLEVEETILSDTETDENEGVTTNDFDVSDIVEEEEMEETVEDVPFMMIQNPPIYPGCKGSKEQLKKCFAEKISKFFNKNFDTNLSQELQLSSGKKRIVVLFTVDKNGNVTKVNARAPHPRMKKEVVSIINNLPKMIPGKQGTTPVGVQFSLPITFWIQ